MCCHKDIIKQMCLNGKDKLFEVISQVITAAAEMQILQKMSGLQEKRPSELKMSFSRSSEDKGLNSELTCLLDLFEVRNSSVLIIGDVSA